MGNLRPRGVRVICQSSHPVSGRAGDWLPGHYPLDLITLKVNDNRENSRKQCCYYSVKSKTKQTTKRPHYLCICGKSTKCYRTRNDEKDTEKQHNGVYLHSSKLKISLLQSLKIIMSITWTYLKITLIHDMSNQKQDIFLQNPLPTLISSALRILILWHLGSDGDITCKFNSKAYWCPAQHTTHPLGG